MRILLAALGTSFLCAVAASAPAQELVGFERSDYGKVVLSRKQSGGIELELSVGSYNNETIRNYSTSSIFAKMGRSVGRLDILTDKGIFSCTAFIVSDRYLLTNHHCVPGIIEGDLTGATRIESVQFVAGYVQQGVEEGTRTFSVSAIPIESDKALDYSLLEVFGNPSVDYGTLQLADATPQDGDPYWVIGHPMGEAQRISREKCRANAPALSGERLLHTCDTLPGNSGSPVIDASLQKVVGLHHAGSQRDSVNFAIPMQLILARSGTLAGLVAAVPPPPPPASENTTNGRTAVCDALYAEARATGDCLIYETFADTCASHPFVAIADSVLTRQCTGTAATAAAAPALSNVSPPDAPRPSVTPNGAESWASGNVEIVRRLNDPDVALISAMNHAISPDGTRLAVVDHEGRVRVWDIDSRKLLLARLEQRGGAKLTGVAFQNDNRRLLAAGVDGSASLLDIDNASRVRRIEDHLSAITSIAYSPDSTRAATSFNDGSFGLWDPATGRMVKHFAGHDSAASDISFSPDGKRIYTASRDKTVVAWNAASGEAERRFTGHEGWVYALDISADGSRMLTGASDGTMRLWDTDTGLELHTFTGTGGNARSVAFAPDGRYAVSVSNKSHVRLWDIQTRRLIRTLDATETLANNASFSRQGHILVVSGHGRDTLVLRPVGTP